MAVYEIYEACLRDLQHVHEFKRKKGGLTNWCINYLTKTINNASKDPFGLLSCVILSKFVANHMAKGSN